MITSPLISYATEKNAHGQLLVVVVMVKNEQDVMEKTLSPFIAAGVQQYLILDTGSTDETVKITNQLFKDHNVQHGYIIEQPFIDFSASRNYALECAERLFDHANFFLMIDAEWCVQNVEKLLNFCAENYQESVDAFAIKIHFGQSQYFVRRLFNAQKKVRFVRKVHEYAQVASYKKISPEIYIIWDNSEKGHEKSKKRWVHDLDVLFQEHKENPLDLRTIFFIGQTYFDLQELELAALWFKKRYDIESIPSEERYQACYQLGLIYQKQNNYRLALEYYYAAHVLNQQRAEPLVQIALYYLEQKDFQAAFLFAQKAETLPEPEHASIVNTMIYQYTRYAVLAIAALAIHEYDKGKNALQKALFFFPENPLLSQLQTTYQTLNQ